MCRVLGVTSSGYYGYMRRQRDNPDDPYHRELHENVKDIARASDDSYGSRRMKKALNILGYPVSRDKARKLMKEAGVQVKHRKKYKVTTDSDHEQPVFGGNSATHGQSLLPANFCISSFHGGQMYHNQMGQVRIVLMNQP